LFPQSVSAAALDLGSLWQSLVERAALRGTTE
jgi:hypothetical protein